MPPLRGEPCSAVADATGDFFAIRSLALKGRAKVKPPLRGEEARLLPTSVLHGKGEAVLHPVRPSATGSTLEACGPRGPCSISRHTRNR